MSEKPFAAVLWHSFLARALIAACVLWTAVGGAAFGAGTEPIATVIAASGTVEVSRGGSRVSLAVKDSIYVDDSILTGVDGKVQILFGDGSAVNVAPGSAFDMSAYADVGDDSNFAANLFQGAVRIITGTITENNPEDFEIKTPLATVGIRGTILYVEADDKHTTVKVFNSDKTVIVNGIAVAETFKITVTLDEEPRIAPLAPGEAEEDTDAIIPPSVASGGETAGLPDAAAGGKDEGAASAGAEDSAGNLMSDIAGHPFVSDIAGHPFDPADVPPLTVALGPPTAHVEMNAPAGTYSNHPLTVASISYPYSNLSVTSLSFSLDVNLNTGGITSGAASGNFQIQEVGGPFALTRQVEFNLTGGTGTFSTPFSGSITFTDSGMGYISSDSPSTPFYSGAGYTYLNNQIDLGATALSVYAPPSGYSSAGVGDLFGGCLKLQNNAGDSIELNTIVYGGPFPDGSVTSVN